MLVQKLISGAQKIMQKALFQNRCHFLKNLKTVIKVVQIEILGVKNRQKYFYESPTKLMKILITTGTRRRGK